MKMAVKSSGIIKLPPFTKRDADGSNQCRLSPICVKLGLLFAFVLLFHKVQSDGKDSGQLNRGNRAPVTSSESNTYWWSSWSTCSKTCGAGLRYRFTFCTGTSTIPDCISKGNRGVASEKMMCKVRDCQESEIRWSQWSECSRSCSEGLQTRMAYPLTFSCTGKEMTPECTRKQYAIQRRPCFGSQCKELSVVTSNLSISEFPPGKPLVFTKDLSNPHSRRFRELKAVIEKAIIPVLKKTTPNIHDFVVTAFSPGSTVVHYELILDKTDELSDTEVHSMLDKIVTEDGEIGNSGIVVAVDKEPPIFTNKPESVTVNTTSGKPYAIVTWNVPGVTDNSGLITKATTHYSGSKFGIGTTTVMCAAFDAAGNKARFSFNVTVKDNEAPVFTNTPGDITVSTDPGLLTAYVDWEEPTVNDNSGTYTVTSSHKPGFTAGIGIVTITYSAVDGSGNAALFSLNLTVKDNEKPTFSNAPISISVNTTSGLPIASVTWREPIVADNSGSVCVVTSTHKSGDKFDIGVTRVTYTATDDYGNKETYSFDVKVTDNEAGVFSSSPSDIAVNTDLGHPTANVTWTEPIVTDNSGSHTVTSSHKPGFPFGIGITTVRYIVVDDSGNMASFSFDVTIIDNEKPRISNAPISISVDTNPGLPIAYVTWTEPIITDNSGVYTISSTHDSGTNFVIGSTRVTYTVTDEAGNVATYFFMVTVIDREAGVFSNTPSDIVVNTDLGHPTANLTWTEPSVTDNSGSYTLTSSHKPGFSFDIGKTTVTYRVVDESGNRASVSFNVTVNDNEAPKYVGTSILVSVQTTPGLSTAKVTWPEPLITDNSGFYTIAASHKSGAKFNIGITNVRYTAIDASGNEATYSFNVTVTDNEAPVVSNIPDDIAVNTDIGQPTANVTWTEPTVTDNSGIYTVTMTHQQGFAFGIGTTPVTYSVVDSSGNQDVVSFNITIKDIERPLIFGAPVSIAVNTTSGLPTANVTWNEPTVTDNSGFYTVKSSHKPWTAFDIGTTTVTYTAVDAEENTAIYSFNITVTDNEMGKFSNTPVSITVNNDPGQASAVVMWQEPTVTDNSGLFTVTSSHTSGFAFGIGITNVIYNVVDANGNMNYFSFDITVVDNEAPVFSGMPISMSVNTTSRIGSAIVTWTEPTASDNSASYTVTSTHNSGENFDIGTTTVTYTAVDVAGNTETFSFALTVIELPNPCVSEPCKNNGVCLQQGEGFFCDCSYTDGFKGPTCQDSAKPLWGSWEAWTKCSVTCGGGTRQRQRICKDPVPEDQKICIGQARDTKDCSNWKCPDCERICEVGALNADCDACECDTSALEGRVTDISNRPLSAANIAYVERPHVSLATTDPAGRFHVLGVCADSAADILVTKATYSSVTKRATKQSSLTSTLVVHLEKLALQSFSDNPSDKNRATGESVAFCCPAESSLPLVYEWFHDEDIVEDPAAKGAKLILHTLREDDSGLYNCRVCSDAGCIMSEPGNLTVSSDSQDSCSATPSSKIISLPEGCLNSETNLAEYDVGTCGNTPCGGRIASETMCKDQAEEFSCCRKGQVERMDVQCEGYTLPVYKVVSCTCGECVQLKSKVIGQIVSTISNEPLDYVVVYFNGTRVARSNRQGRFEYVTNKQAKRVSLTFKDYYQKRVTDTTIIVTLNRGSVKYEIVKMKHHPPPVIINSTQETILPLVGDGSDPVAELIIEPNSIYDKNGNLFNGDVKLTIDNIDMRNPSNTDVAPGDFSTIDESGNPLGLQTFGIFSIGMTDQSGNPLAVGGSSLIEIDQSMVPDCQVDDKDGTCEASIWDFNEKTGSWEFSSPLVLSRSGGRRKRQSPVFVANVDVNFGQLMSNIDAVSSSREWCWVKIAAYQSERCLNTLPTSQYDVTWVSERRDTGSRFRQGGIRWSVVKYVDSICMGMFCDVSRAPRVENRKFTIWLSATENMNAKSLLPARSENDYKWLDYTLITESGAEEKYFIRMKPATDLFEPNGPVYEGVRSGLEACRRADLSTSNHLQFFQPSQSITCATAHTADPEIIPPDIQTETFYPRLIEEFNRQQFCFVRIRVRTMIHSTIQVLAESAFESITSTNTILYGWRSVHATKEEGDDFMDACMEFRCSPDDGSLQTFVNIRAKTPTGDELTCPFTLNTETRDFKNNIEMLGLSLQIPFTFPDPRTYGVRYGMEKHSGININGLCAKDINSPQCVDPDVHCNSVKPAIIINCP